MVTKMRIGQSAAKLRLGEGSTIKALPACRIQADPKWEAPHPSVRKGEDMIWSAWKHVAGVITHRDRLANGLDNTFDGDTVSFNAILSDEANTEIAQYLASPKSLMDINRRFISGEKTDLIALVFHNMTID